MTMSREMPRLPGIQADSTFWLIISILAGVLTQGCAGLDRSRTAPASEPGIARGVVFEDRDRDGVRDPKEPPLSGIRVSNGREIVSSDRHGRYELPVDQDTILFVVKPTGMMTSIDERRIPRFYYVHKPLGSPPHHAYPGIPPTGPLPDSVDFGLYPRPEPKRFQVIFLGDPQPYNETQVDYLARDILEELPASEAAFGVSLGDLVGDDLSLLDPLSRSVALVGIPWYSLLGNHDLNFDALDDRHSDETFERVFGPASYAFEYGHVHFIVLDDVIFHPASPENDRGPSYDGGLTPRQLDFIERYLATVPKHELVVLMMHIPLVGEGGNQVPQRRQLLELLASHPHTLSVSAHTHVQAHHFLGPEEGNPGPIHHHWNSGTASGNWWMGTQGRGRDPPRHHAGRHAERLLDRPLRRQRLLDPLQGCPAPRGLPDEHLRPRSRIPWQAATSTQVRVNVFAGSERSTVEMRLVPLDASRSSDWIPLEPSAEIDPSYEALWAEEARSDSRAAIARSGDQPAPLEGAPARRPRRGQPLDRGQEH